MREVDGPLCKGPPAHLHTDATPGAVVTERNGGASLREFAAIQDFLVTQLTLRVGASSLRLPMLASRVTILTTAARRYGCSYNHHILYNSGLQDMEIAIDLYFIKMYDAVK